MFDFSGFGKVDKSEVYDPSWGKGQAWAAKDDASKWNNVG